MTIKTIIQASSTSLESTKNMKKVVKRNLFGTTVDRVELNQAIAQQESESNRSLKTFKTISVIGLIGNEDRPRKRFPTEDDSSEDSTRQASSTDDAAPSSNQPTTSSKMCEVRPLNKLKKTGQQRLTDYFPIIKRQRKNRH